MSDKGFIVTWFYNLPPVSSDDEIDDLAKTSIVPLLRAHEAIQQPLVLVAPGSFLRRLASIEPSIVDKVGRMVADGLIELGATFFYEIYPPVIPFRYIRRHLEKDIGAKEQMFGVRPNVFFSPNFAWLSIFSYLLADLKIQYAILDEGHYRLCASTQGWKWDLLNPGKMETVLLDTYIDERELFRRYRHAVATASGEKALRLHFRDFEATKNLSYGTSGLIHHPLGELGLVSYLSEKFGGLDSGDYVTLADDGDRISPTSISNYQVFLRFAADSGMTTTSGVSEPDDRLLRIEYLPSYAIGAHRDFWTRDLDSVGYLDLLSALYREGVEDEMEERVLELQDSYFLFWKNHPRKLYYLRRLYELLEGKVDGWASTANAG